jgi:hypothetical protein
MTLSPERLLAAAGLVSVSFAALSAIITLTRWAHGDQLALRTLLSSVGIGLLGASFVASVRHRIVSYCLFGMSLVCLAVGSLAL